MHGDRACLCLLCVESVGGVGWASHHLGWCWAGDHSSSGVTAEEAAYTNISRNIVFTCSQWSTALWRFIWKQGPTPRHTEYRREHSSNTTDKQAHNISLQIFFKASKYFLCPGFLDPLLLGGLMTWQPSSARPQVPGTGATREQAAISI